MNKMLNYNLRTLPVTGAALRCVGLLSVIYLLLECYYFLFIAHRFDYMGFALKPDLIKYLFTKLCYLGLLLASFYVMTHSKFLFFIYLLLIFFFYIPNSILYSLGDFPNTPFFSNLIFLGIFSFSPFIRFYIPATRLTSNSGNYFVYGLVLLMLIPILLKFGLNINFKTLILSDIYETRAKFSDKLHGLSSYLYHILTKTVIPAALIYSLIKRKFALAVFLLAALMYLYLISGNKIVYFSTFILLFFYFFGKKLETQLSNFFILIIVSLVIFPMIDSFLAEPVLAGTFVNRFLFIPALLTQFYFDFFNNQPLFFAESHFFNSFISSPYPMPVGFLITWVYWGVPDVYANNGIVSDGFMNLGMAGVLLFSVIFSVLFGLFASFRLRPAFTGIYFIYLYLVLSSPFLACLVTGGISIFILLAFTVFNQKLFLDSFQTTA